MRSGVSDIDDEDFTVHFLPRAVFKAGSGDSDCPGVQMGEAAIGDSVYIALNVGRALRFAIEGMPRFILTVLVRGSSGMGSWLFAARTDNAFSGANIVCTGGQQLMGIGEIEQSKASPKS